MRQIEKEKERERERERESMYLRNAWQKECTS